MYVHVHHISSRPQGSRDPLTMGVPRSWAEPGSLGGADRERRSRPGRPGEDLGDVTFNNGFHG